MKRITSLTLTALFTVLLASPMLASESESSVIRLSGSGASFPNILFQRMFKQYHKYNPVLVKYQPVGSIRGIDQLLDGRVHFAATDIAYTEEDPLQERFTYVPVTIGAVTVVYNVPGFESIRLSPEVLVDIFSGKIKRWNDHRIHALNPHFSLPNFPIKVIHRNDPSGTTYMFSSYLSKTSSSWRNRFGAATTVDWEVGQGFNGNNAVGKEVSKQVGSISYVEWHVALKYSLNVASVKNASGYYVNPAFDSILTTAREVMHANDQDAPDALIYRRAGRGYPMCGISWIMIHKEQKGIQSYDMAKSLVNLVYWMSNEGQIQTVKLDGSDEEEFPPIPDWAIRLARKRLVKVTYDGERLLQSGY